MRPTKYLTGDEYTDIFFHNGRYWFFKDLDDRLVVIPAVGDIIEYENGERSIVLNFSSLDKNGELGLDIKISKEAHRGVGLRGRSFDSLKLSGESDEGVWPGDSSDSKLIRDGRVIFPISKFYYMANSLILFRRNIVNKASLLKNLTSMKLRKFYNQIKNKYNQIKEFASMKLRKFYNQIKNKYNQIKEFVSIKLSKFYSQIKNKYNQIKEFVSDIFFRLR